MRGGERRREKEGEEDPSCDRKSSVAREGLRGKAYARRKISIVQERGRRKTSQVMIYAPAQRSVLGFQRSSVCGDLLFFCSQVVKGPFLLLIVTLHRYELRRLRECHVRSDGSGLQQLLEITLSLSPPVIGWVVYKFTQPVRRMDIWRSHFHEQFLFFIIISQSLCASISSLTNASNWVR